VKGTLPYMSPEQFYGLEIDARSDIFSVGIVLWECLAQRKLFAGLPPGEAMVKICEGPREPPSAYRPEIPAELDAIALKALHTDRDARYGSARAFASELLAVLAKIHPNTGPQDVSQIVDSVLGPDRNAGASVGSIEGADRDPSDLLPNILEEEE